MSVSENKGVFMNIALCGIHGAMGKILKDEIEQSDENKLVGYFSPRNGITGQDISEKIDVIIDFSRPENIDFLLDYALKNKVALVICTTGYTDEQVEKIKKAGENIRVLLSSNTSIGINILRKIAMLISPTMKDFDIEIVEAHHNKKKDMPSGTAKTLKSDVLEATGKNDIPVHSLRAGNIVGEHEIVFAKDDEVIKISHTALSKRIFAVGAIDLSEKLLSKDIGFYDTMELI
jgi:dihydrodipicolinate reductase